MYRDTSLTVDVCFDFVTPEGLPYMVANRGLEKAEPGASWQTLFNTLPGVAIMKLSACDVIS